MSKLGYVCIFVSIVPFANCSNEKISPAECVPVVEAMFENFQKLDPDKAQGYAEQKQAIVSVLQKECESGKYKLDCLKIAKDPIAIQACKK